MMAKLVAKFGARLPELLTRAIAGDPTAIGTLIAFGGVAVVAWLSDKNK